MSVQMSVMKVESFVFLYVFFFIYFCFYVLCKYYHKKIWRTLRYSYGIRLIKRLLNESSFGNVLRDFLHRHTRPSSRRVYYSPGPNE